MAGLVPAISFRRALCSPSEIAGINSAMTRRVKSN
jgi:hypothetical protein